MISLYDTESKTSCLGMVFKATRQTYVTSTNRICFKVELIPIKRKSCPGCQHCGWLSSMLLEINDEWPIIGLNECQPGKLYTIVICNDTIDWESGITDDWGLCAVEYTEEIK
jgi:hypothetical protein